MTEKQIKEEIKYIQDFQTAISGKWKLAIIIAINHGKNRFKEIQASVPKITNRVLSKELKDLETNLMITRTVYDTMPVTIEYKVTGYCLTIRPVIQMMTAWGREHRRTIVEKLS